MPTPTVKPNPSFNAEKTSTELRDAMKGLGTNESKIIQALTTITTAQRQDVIAKFKTLFGRELIPDLKSELGGSLENVVLELLMTDAERDATTLRKAMKGAGTDEEMLIEILSSRSNSEIALIKSVYKSKFDRDLEKDLKSETTGDFERLLVGLVQASRDERATADVAKAQADAKALLDAGEKSWGTDEGTFQRVMLASSPAQLRAVAEEYQKIAHKDLDASIQSEMGGSLAKGFSALVLLARNPGLYFAQRVNAAMAGAGTDEELLTHLIVSRSERDLGDVKTAYRAKYGKSLEDAIAGECGGDFKKVLIALATAH